MLFCILLTVILILFRFSSASLLFIFVLSLRRISVSIIAERMRTFLLCKWFFSYVFAGITFYAATFEEYTKLKVFNHENIRYGCTRCQKTYLQKKTLGRHLRFDCGQSPSFTCQICQKKFKHGYILLKHMRHTHDIQIQKLRQRHPKPESEMITILPSIDL